MKSNLKINLLIYINYCLSGKIFDYNLCLKDLASLGITATLSTLRKEFSLLKKDNLIEFRLYYHRKYPVLTQKGKFMIKSHLRFRKLDFDGLWRVVIFDIPENRKKDRLELQKKLLDLGFGKLSRAVYISPNPLLSTIKRMTQDLGLCQNVTLLKINLVEDEKEVITRAWKLEAINDQYRDFLSQSRKRLLKHDHLWPLRAKILEEKFMVIYDQDPHLPKEFLPTSWQGQLAYNYFKKLCNSY